MNNKEFFSICLPYEGAEVEKVINMTNKEIKDSLNRCFNNREKLSKEVA